MALAEALNSNDKEKIKASLEKINVQKRKRGIANLDSHSKSGGSKSQSSVEETAQKRQSGKGNEPEDGNSTSNNHEKF